MLYSYTSMALFLYLDLCLSGIYVHTKCKVGIQFFFSLNAIHFLQHHLLNHFISTSICNAIFITSLCFVVYFWAFFYALWMNMFQLILITVVLCYIVCSHLSFPNFSWLFLLKSFYISTFDSACLILNFKDYYCYIDWDQVKFTH